MLSDFRRRDPGQPLKSLLFYWVCFHITRAAFTLLYRLRVYHAGRVPEHGGLVIIANHQSHFDPPAIAIALPTRHVVPIARQGLFKNRFLAWLLVRLNSISINEKEGDAVAMRRAIAELKSGRCVLIFPEGARTPDGTVREFKRGTWLLLSRSKCPVVPAAIEGAFNAWPRQRSAPSLWGKRISIAFGEPIPFDELHALGADAALDRLASEVETLRADLHDKLFS